MAEEGSNGKVKWWEYVNNPDDLRDHAESWSLAGDAAIATLLNNISKFLITSTDSLSKKLDELVQNASQLEVEVSNSNNAFTMLSHTQFIENRTYLDDDRPDVSNAVDQRNTDNREEMSPSELYSTALNKGLSALNNFYNKHVVTDSEDEGDQDIDTQCGTSLYSLKNPYLLKPLPHIIMSREFTSDPLIGLSVGVEEEGDELEDILASSCDEDIGDENIFDKTFQPTSSNLQADESDSDDNWSEVNLPTNKLSANDDSSRVISVRDDNSPLYHQQKNTSAPLPVSNISDMVNNNGCLLPIINNTKLMDSDSDEEFFKPVSATKNNVLGRSNYVAPNAPPNNSIATEFNNRFNSGRTTQQIISSSESEDDLFKGRPPPLPDVTNVRALPDRAAPDTLQSNVLKQQQVKASNLESVKKSLTQNGIFSSDTEEDDLFGIRPPPLNVRDNNSCQSPNDFNDITPTETSDSHVTSQERQTEGSACKVPVGGVNIFSPTITAAIRTPYDRDDIVTSGVNRNTSPFFKQNSSNKENVIKTSLCDDEDQDALFDGAKISSKSSIAQQQKSVTNVDNKTNVTTHSRIPSPKQISKGLFSSDDEDLFNPSSNKLTINKQLNNLHEEINNSIHHKETTPQSKTNVDNNIRVNKESLLFNNSDDHLFSNISSNKPAKGGVTSDRLNQGIKRPETIAVNNEQSKAPLTAPNKGLFSSSSDEEALFSLRSLQTLRKTRKLTPPTVDKQTSHTVTTDKKFSNCSDGKIESDLTKDIKGKFHVKITKETVNNPVDLTKPKSPIISLTRPSIFSTDRGGLFDSSSDEDFISSPPPKVKENQTLFDGSSDEENQFPKVSHAIDYKELTTETISKLSNFVSTKQMTNNDIVSNVPKSSNVKISKRGSESIENNATLNPINSNDEHKIKKTTDLFLSDDDDIFGEVLSNNSSVKAVESKTTGLLNTVSEDDDIFNYLSGEQMFGGKTTNIFTNSKGKDLVSAKDSNEKSKTDGACISKSTTSVKVESNLPAVKSLRKPLFGNSELLSQVKANNETLDKMEVSSASNKDKPKLQTKDSNNVTISDDQATAAGENITNHIPKKKPPVGGIALFGGAELQAKLRKRRTESSDNEIFDDIKTPSLSNSTIESPLSPISFSKKKPSSPSKPLTSPVHKFLTSQGFSPSTTLASGISADQTVNKEEPSSFESTPAASNVLTSLIKERPKGNRQRRPPSRQSFKKRPEKQKQQDDVGSKHDKTDGLKSNDELSTFPDNIVSVDSAMNISKHDILSGSKPDSGIGSLNSESNSPQGAVERQHFIECKKDKISDEKTSHASSKVTSQSEDEYNLFGGRITSKTSTDQVKSPDNKLETSEAKIDYSVISSTLPNFVPLISEDNSASKSSEAIISSTVNNNSSLFDNEADLFSIIAAKTKCEDKSIPSANTGNKVVSIQAIQPNKSNLMQTNSGVTKQTTSNILRTKSLSSSSNLFADDDSEEDLFDFGIKKRVQSSPSHTQFNSKINKAPPSSAEGKEHRENSSAGLFGDPLGAL